MLLRSLLLVLHQLQVKVKVKVAQLNAKVLPKVQGLDVRIVLQMKTGIAIYIRAKQMEQLNLLQNLPL